MGIRRMVRKDLDRRESEPAGCPLTAMGAMQTWVAPIHSPHPRYEHAKQEHHQHAKPKTYQCKNDWPADFLHKPYG